MLKTPSGEPIDATPPTEHWTDAIGTQADCLHCGAVREHEYCGHCGQRHIDRRLRFGEWLGQMVSRVTQLDRGVLYTFGQLVIRPGHVAKEYVSGRRKPYLNPLTCFFLGAAMQLFTIWVLEDRLRDMIGAPIAKLASQEKSEPVQAIEARTGMPIDQLAVETYLDAMQQGYTYLALITLTIPLAVFSRFGHRLLGEKLLLAETMVWSLYSVSLMLIFTAITNLILIPQIGQMAGIIGIGSYFVIAWHSHQGFFQRGVLSRGVTLVSMGCATICFAPSIFLTFLATFLIRIVLSG